MQHLTEKNIGKWIGTTLLAGSRDRPVVALTHPNNKLRPDAFDAGRLKAALGDRMVLVEMHDRATTEKLSEKITQERSVHDDPSTRRSFAFARVGAHDDLDIPE